MIDIGRIVDDAGVLVLVTDRGGEVVYHNRTAAERLGWAGERLSLSTLTDREMAERLLSGTTAAGASSRIETLTLRRKLGEPLALRAVVSTLIDSSGDYLVRIFGVDESVDRLVPSGPNTSPRCCRVSSKPPPRQCGAWSTPSRST